jgi:ABC-type nitrate/sulfonate/bicarbonate transport system permease component
MGMPQAMPCLFALRKVSTELACVCGVIAEAVASNKEIAELMQSASSNNAAQAVPAGLAVLGVLMQAATAVLKIRTSAQAFRDCKIHRRPLWIGRVRRAGTRFLEIP